jgi:hypothetical protein
VAAPYHWLTRWQLVKLWRGSLSLADRFRYVVAVVPGAVVDNRKEVINGSTWCAGCGPWLILVAVVKLWPVAVPDAG